MATGLKKSPHLSQIMAHNVNSHSSPSGRAGNRNSSDFFELRRPDGNAIDWSMRSDIIAGPPRSVSYRGMSSGNNMLDLSARSEGFVPSHSHAPSKSRRASERIYVDSRQPFTAAKRRTSSRMNPNLNMLDNLPESSAVMEFQRPGKMKPRRSAPDLGLDPREMMEIHAASALVNDNFPVQNSSSTGQKSLRRSTIQVNSGSYRSLLNDHYQVKNSSVGRPDLQSSMISDISDMAFEPEKSRSQNNSTDVAVLLQQQQTHSPKGILLKTQPSFNDRNKPRNDSPHITKMPNQTKQIQNLPVKQIDAMRLLKQKEQGYLQNGLNSFTRTVSTINSSMRMENNPGRLTVRLASSKKIASGRSFHSSIRDLSENAVASDTDRRKGSRCGRYKKVVIVGLFLLLLGLGLGGYFVFLYEVGGETENEAINTPDDAMDNAKTNDTGIVSPPCDIEARCSASNLPGSLSACLSACLPSACCYSGFSGETCTNNAGCSLYKPYCDVFYDSWPEGAEGVLPEVTDEIVDMCTGALTRSDVQSLSSVNSLVNSSVGLSKSSLDRKRLRGHDVQQNNGSASTMNSRTLVSPTAHETCENYCITARCCEATIVDDAGLSGLVRSPSGVYTNASSGNYVVTNCQVRSDKNVQLCSRYREFCSTDEKMTRPDNSSTAPSTSTRFTPSAAPSPREFTTLTTSTFSQTLAGIPVALNASSPLQNQTALEILSTGNNTIGISNSSLNSVGLPNATMLDTNISLSPSTSAMPSSTLQPSTSTKTPIASPTFNEDLLLIPSANAQSIQDSCATDKAKFLIRTGDSSARAECIQACLDGLCCFTEDLGYSLVDSCSKGNEYKCSQYASCLILKDSTLQENTNDTFIASNINSTSSSEGQNITSRDTTPFSNSTLNSNGTLASVSNVTMTNENETEHGATPS